MKIRILAFGIAKEILQSKNLEMDLNHGDNIQTLKGSLFKKFPDLSSLVSISFAVGEDYQDDAYILHENDEVIIIPPVSGG